MTLLISFPYPVRQVGESRVTIDVPSINGTILSAEAHSMLANAFPPAIAARIDDDIVDAFHSAVVGHTLRVSHP